MRYKLIYAAQTSTERGGEYKWDGKMFCRHGGDLHKSWWFQSRSNEISLELDGCLCDHLVCGDLDVCVYVKENKKEIANLRNEFMKYVGGQSLIQCSLHKFPFIVSSGSEGKCYQVIDDVGNVCNRKIKLMCPDLKCGSGVCDKCATEMTRDDIILINPPECERSTDSDIFVGNNCGNESYSSDSKSDDVSVCDEFDDDIDLFAPQDDDNIDDFFDIRRR